MTTTLTIRPPEDYDLARDVCSYGYFVLAPNLWLVEDRALVRALALPDGAVTVRITQPNDSPGSTLRARFDRRLTRDEQGKARAQIARMLRLDEDIRHIKGFHRVDRRWRRSGRGRLFRSPTLFEDVIKTVTSCNVAWPSTVRMNDRLCVVCGGRTPSGSYAFPTPKRLARTRPGTLRARCRVGYRDQRIVDLARLFARGAIDEAWLTDPATPDDDAFALLKTLPGIGPYGAGNIMQLLGRYSFLAIDTESLRHGRTVLGYDGTDAQVHRHLREHYDAFGAHKFRAYWFELWNWYESRAGPASQWVRDEVAESFTASKF